MAAKRRYAEQSQDPSIRSDIGPQPLPPAAVSHASPARELQRTLAATIDARPAETRRLPLAARVLVIAVLAATSWAGVGSLFYLLVG